MKIMKAKTYGKDATKFSPNALYYASIKYDGNLIKIVQEGDKTRWFTSNDKEFSLPIKMPSGDYTLIAEFMYNCKGKLGDRRYSAILTTLRTNFAKGLSTDIDSSKINLKVHDIVNDEPFIVRKEQIMSLVPHLSVSHYPIQGRKALEWVKSLVKVGWEGVVIRAPQGKYEPGKRVHHMIKIKFRPTADLLCIGEEQGEGKCEGIGALVLQDSKGRIVKVGSGLDYSSETRKGGFVGKVIEIEYEQIMDTYIQPSFIAVRDDKGPEDID